MKYHLPVGTFIERCNGAGGPWEPFVVLKAVTYDEADVGPTIGGYMYFRLPPVVGWTMIRVLNRPNESVFLIPELHDAPAADPFPVP